jgi:hypothetical protein
MSALGQKQTSDWRSLMSALWSEIQKRKAQVASRRRNGKTVTRRERVTDHILTTEWESAVNFAKYDVERAEYRRNVSEHVSASQEIHCRQVWE